MNFIELATQRSSVRNFKSGPIEKEKILYVLEAARLAPSAANFQPWHFIVVTEPEILKLLLEVYPRDWMATAPAVIVALGDHDKGWRRSRDGKDFTNIDVAISVDHLTLAAAESGLGTCWVCNFDPKKCCVIFNLPENLEPIALIPIGYPAKTSKSPKQREPLNQITHWNSF
jgi:nitroreductase